MCEISFEGASVSCRLASLEVRPELSSAGVSETSFGSAHAGPESFGVAPVTQDCGAFGVGSADSESPFGAVDGAGMDVSGDASVEDPSGRAELAPWTDGVALEAQFLDVSAGAKDEFTGGLLESAAFADAEATRAVLGFWMRVEFEVRAHPYGKKWKQTHLFVLVRFEIAVKSPDPLLMAPHPNVKRNAAARLVGIQIARNCSDEWRGEQSGLLSIIVEYMKDAVDFPDQFNCSWCGQELQECVKGTGRLSSKSPVLRIIGLAVWRPQGRHPANHPYNSIKGFLGGRDIDLSGSQYQANILRANRHYYRVYHVCMLAWDSMQVV